MEVINEIRYAEGFNKGYIMFQYEPEIAQSFIDNEVVVYNDFSSGFKQGLRQAHLEKEVRKFEQTMNKANEHDQGLER